MLFISKGINSKMIVLVRGNSDTITCKRGAIHGGRESCLRPDRAGMSSLRIYPDLPGKNVYAT